MQSMFPPSNNGPVTTLAAALGAAETTMELEDVSKLPAAPNVLTIGSSEDAELVRYTSVTGNYLAIERGFNGTVAKAWEAGTRVGRYITAQDISALQRNITELDEEKAENEHTHEITDISGLETDLETLETYIPIVKDITVTALPYTATDNDIKAYHKCTGWCEPWGNVSSDLTVTMSNGGYSISGTVSGPVTIHAIFFRPKSGGGSSVIHKPIPADSGSASLVGGKVAPTEASSGIVTISESTTLSLVHAGKTLNCINNSPITITIPADASVEFPAGTEIEFAIRGSGSVTFAGETGVTLESKNSALSTTAQFGWVGIKKFDTDVWDLNGDLS